jgi:hypothetical protein
MTQTIQDDRIFPVTRWVLAVVNVALLFAFLVLYLFPQTTRTNFAWDIQPNLTAVFMGAGYISGAYMFLFAIFGKKWHRAKNSIPPVSTFAAVMLVVTLLHYDRFIHGNLGFILWLIIYIITPFLVPWLWFHNRVTDPGTLDARDRVVPRWVRGLAGLIGIASLLFWIVNFIVPTLLIGIWPWKLTPLTARTLCAWGMLISVGGLVMYFELRWSAWRYNIQAIALWQVLMVIGSILHRQDFNNGSLINPYFIAILIILGALVLLTVWMEYTISHQALATQAPRPASPE